MMGLQKIVRDCLLMAVVATPLLVQSRIQVPNGHGREDSLTTEKRAGFGTIHGMKNVTSFAERRTMSNSQSRKTTEERQRVLILPGPHKTGSSSIQKNMFVWTKSGAIANWKWPFLEGDPKNGKNLLQLVFDLDSSSGNTKDLFSTEFRRLWQNGQSIVFGNEHLDWVLKDQGSNSRLIDGLLDMMPWASDQTVSGTNDLITVSVTYRSPRVEQLISVWHQYGKEGEALSSFILRLRHDNTRWKCTMNPLGVANAFVARGLSTVIIDTDGLHRDGLDISSVIACDVMGVKCMNNTVVGLHEPPEIKNARMGRGNFDLSSEVLSQVNDVLGLMDLSYCHLRYASNVRVLYGQELFSLCNGSHQVSGMTSEEALGRIKEVVNLAVGLSQ